MPRRILVLLIVSAVIVSTALLVSRSQKAAAASFTVEQIKSYPFPNELTASATGARIATREERRGSGDIRGPATRRNPCDCGPTAPLLERHPCGRSSVPPSLFLP